MTITTMSEKKALRLWQISTLLLLVCNISLMLSIWCRPGRGADGPRHEAPREFVIRNLAFSDAQIKQYDVLIPAHQQAMRRLRQEAMNYREALFANLNNPNRDTLLADSLTNLIATTQKQIEIITYNHFRQVRAICTDKQKPEFDRIIDDVIKKMNGRGGPPPPDGHRPPPDGPEAPPPPPDDREPPPPHP